tara:strand:+ start:49 stop:258 length:210 start_codon:yes stop_codon:yes gene_type:complete
MVLTAILEQLGLQVLWAIQVLQVLKGLRVILGRQVHKVTQEFLEPPDLKDHRETQGLKVHVVTQVWQVR